jgi:hypothetical protein
VGGKLCWRFAEFEQNSHDVLKKKYLAGVKLKNIPQNTETSRTMLKIIFPDKFPCNTAI